MGNFTHITFHHMFFSKCQKTIFFNEILVNLVCFVECEIFSLGWNQYCTDCACLDPNATGTTPAPCADIKPAKWCLRKKNQNKCNRSKVAARCQKTCEKC